MTRKCYNHKPICGTAGKRHSIKSQTTLGRQSKAISSLFLREKISTRKNTKYCIAKRGLNQKPQETMEATINRALRENRSSGFSKNNPCEK